ncbi:MAG: CRTAC1 family protein [Alcanivoracaceae bacterium]|nr:CRTAC1 family protein [Alcanivoracaceae bacterium]
MIGSYNTFTDIASSVFVTAEQIDGRGIAFADFDNDGDVDVVITDGNSAGFSQTATRLLRNDSINNNHWLVIKLIGTISNRSAIGARVEIRTNTTTIVQEVSGGAGRGSQNSLPLEFGLGQATVIEEISIRWPHGQREIFNNISMDQRITIVEKELIFAGGFE